MNTGDISKYLWKIRNSPVFRNVPMEIIEEILREEDTFLLQAEEGTLLQDGVMYIILEGSVVIEKGASDGRFVTMHIASAPAPVNIAAALSGEKSDSRMTVREEGFLLSISGATLEKAVRGGGQLAVNITLFLTNRIQFLNKRIISLAGYSAVNRLTMYLKEALAQQEQQHPQQELQEQQHAQQKQQHTQQEYEEKNRDASPKDASGKDASAKEKESENIDKNVISLPMSLTDFAEYIGVGRASLYRAIDSLEKAGKIRSSGRKIEILDRNMF